jgi:hypothetical protein
VSKRLQVLPYGVEYNEIRTIARENGMTTTEWVREALREAKRESPHARAPRELAALDAAVSYSFPTADIGQMLTEIEEGHGSGVR